MSQSIEERAGEMIRNEYGELFNRAMGVDWAACQKMMVRFAMSEIQAEWKINNPSWPPGKNWTIEYDKEHDCYKICTEHGAIVASVGPTLLAYAIANTNNKLRVNDEKTIP